MKKRPHLQISILVLLCMAANIPQPAKADVNAATIRGQIKISGLDSSAGTQIILKNQERGFSTRTFSREDGSYVLMAIRPGRYEFKVLAADGREFAEEVVLQVGQAMTLDKTIGAPVEAEQTNQHGLGLKTSEVATYLTPEQMQRLPQLNRNFLNYADLAPGVNVLTDENGSTRVQSGGQRPDGINLFLDGVGQKNYVVRGGVAGQDSSPGNAFPESAVAEYKVISQNYKAEFDQVGSAAISVQTKSGANQFAGQAFYDYTNQDLRGSTPSENLRGGKLDTDLAQYGVTLSGPVAKDIAHFFMAYERRQNDALTTVAAGDGSALPAPYQALLGKVNQPFTENLFFGKLDWALNDKNLLEISFKLRDETQTLGLGGANAPSYALNKDNGEKRLDVKYQYSAEHWVNVARFTYEDVNWQQQPVENSAGVQLKRLYGALSSNSLNNIGVLNSGGATNFQEKAQSGPGLQDDLTFSGLQWQGSHVVKLGAKFKRILLSALERDPINPQFSFNLNNAGGTPYQVQWAMPLAGAGNGATSSDSSLFGVYLQDDWDLNKHLSLNLGARWDYEYNPGYLNYVTPTDVSSALRNWSNINNPKAGYNIENYISTGSNRSAPGNNFAPRLGLAYDFNEDQRHILFGGFARAYDRNIYDVLQLERTKGTYPTSSLYFQGDPNYDCSAGADCIAWNQAYLNYNSAQLAALGSAASGTNREVDLLRNNLKTPYSDQFTIGMRNRIGDWNTEISYSKVHSYDGLVGLWGGRNTDGSFSAPGSSFGNNNQLLPGYGSLILWDNAVQTKTDSVYLKAEKPYGKDDGWGLAFAYTFTDSKENKPNSFVDSSSYLLDIANTQSIGWLSTAGVSSHKLVGSGSIDLPWDLIFSAKLTLATPQTQSGINCNGGPCRFDTFTPRGREFILPLDWWGYRQVDIALIKSFDTPRDTRMKLRLDVLNLFDFRNYSAFNGNFASADLGSPLTVLAGPALTIKLTARLEF